MRPAATSILVAAIAIALALPACSRPRKPTPEELLAKMQGSGKTTCPAPPLEVVLQGDAQLNPSEGGRSMPVEVRMLLLRDRAKFDQLDFETVWQSASEELGTDLLSSASITVFPSKIAIHTLKTTTDAAFIALVAIFRKPEGRGWGYVVDVREQNRRCAGGDEALHTVVQAHLRGNTITRPSEAIAP